MPILLNSQTHGPRANRRTTHLSSSPTQWVPAMQASTRSSNNKMFAQPPPQCHTRRCLQAHHQFQPPMASHLMPHPTYSTCRKNFSSLNILDPHTSKAIPPHLPPSTAMLLRQRHTRVPTLVLRNHSNKTRLGVCLIREYLLLTTIMRAFG